MIKGALIFAAGLAIGYVKAVSEMESTSTLVTEAREVIQAMKDSREPKDTIPEEQTISEAGEGDETP